ncbi:MAG TPA: hypothetical protein V6D12_17020 [Candidatus Obscuribacterales bacterium]
MKLTWLDRLGDWNPQLFREIKGRLTPRNLAIAVAISLVGQLLVLMSLAGQLPANDAIGEVRRKYCTGIKPEPYYQPLCVRDALGAFEINWQLWSLDVFLVLSLIGIFGILVVGTHMLISDLSREEHRGTLNFIRLSPQSSSNILTGKLLGVPILLYVAVALALPLHLLLGLAANISLSLILSFYAVLGASCLFFYSLSLLYGLVSSGIGGFQAFLGSGSVLMFLLVTTEFTYNTPVDWLKLFNPSMALPYLFGSSPLTSSISPLWFIEKLKLSGFFYLPVGASAWSAIGFMLLNYALWNYWAWQGLKRCFHNPNATIFSKRQSYLLTACFEVMILGFASQPVQGDYYSRSHSSNLGYLLIFNLLLFVFLIAALSPHRQVLQDWARYRHQKQSSRKWGVVRDLIWGEKSPAPLAVAMNLAIAATILTPWVLLGFENDLKIPALLGLLLSANLILIYACVAQLMLFMKTQKRALWAASTVAGLIILPPIILGFLSIEPHNFPALWLFSAFASLAVKDASITAIFMAVVGESLTLTLLGLQLTRQLRQAGESASKALFANRPSLPNSINS